MDIQRRDFICLGAAGVALAARAAQPATPLEQADFRYMFAKSVFSCMTTLYARSCRLTRPEKRAVVSQIVNDPRVQRRCRGCAGGLPTRLLCAVLRSRLVGLNLFVFRLVAWCGEHLPRLFTRIKHRK